MGVEGEKEPRGTEAEREAGELSDDQLGAVAGGTSRPVPTVKTTPRPKIVFDGVDGESTKSRHPDELS